MQRFQRYVLIAAAIVLPGAAQAGMSVSLDDKDCDIESPYSLDLKGEGIAFSSKTARPAHVRLSDGRLYIDGREVSLSAGDRRTIGNMEQEVRLITGEAVVIASEGIDIAFDALSEVSQALVENDARRADVIRSMEKTRSIVQTQIRDAVLNRPFDEKAFGALIESQVETLASELVQVVVGEFVPKAIAAAMSGDEAGMKSIEARAERLEQEIERKVEAKAREIERRAEALCPRVKALVELESTLAVRLDDGSSLNLLEN
jgi:hypothetical protein